MELGDVLGIGLAADEVCPQSAVGDPVLVQVLKCLEVQQAVGRGTIGACEHGNQ